MIDEVVMAKMECGSGRRRGEANIPTFECLDGQLA